MRFFSYVLDDNSSGGPVSWNSGQNYWRRGTATACVFHWCLTKTRARYEIILLRLGSADNRCHTHRYCLKIGGITLGARYDIPTAARHSNADQEGKKKKKNNKRKTKSNWNIEKKTTTKKHRLGRLKGETSSPHRSFGVSRLRISYLHRTNNINRTAPADWNPIVDSYFNSLSLRVARTRLSVPIKNHKDVSHTRIIIGWKKKNPYESSGSKICRYTRLGGADCRCRSLIE